MFVRISRAFDFRATCRLALLRLKREKLKTWPGASSVAEPREKRPARFLVDDLRPAGFFVELVLLDTRRDALFLPGIYSSLLFSGLS
jgi:hypothetical protein